ncbi:MAG TPA: 4Fe-4S dicluster domain-containing protein [Bryobacteraceae bacterium]|nr:4Fe-4S dicluster domain-containing protein [Bryobacteraceae bacterium]
MAELVPIPLPLLWRRAVLEFQRDGKIFDLPKNKFFRGFPGLDLSVEFHGHRAATPLGPAAGPHGQLAQNIVLSWLGGSRIIELKTIQVLDELRIPRPCIDAANVGYNVEWSQELTLDQSLREYVGAAMFLEMLKASRLLGDGIPMETVFDMSVGYGLEGIRSRRVTEWIRSMTAARAVIEELRGGLPAEFRDLPFPEKISDTVSLSTFHGCPAGEIEGIAEYLIGELGCHVCIKLNPTLLGRDEVAHLLHDVLGYREIELKPAAFANDLQWDEAIDLVPRLQGFARRHGKSLSVKFSNTLVVKNHKHLLEGDVMYMSGAPLHVLALHLVQKFRGAVHAAVPISFSGGLDAHNVADTLALNLIPVTTCTDLLRPGGYGRLIRYLENLGTRMRDVGVANIPDYVAHYAGRHAELIAKATANPRYRWERNKGVPRNIGTRLWLYDCINCEKCIPVCPNDANFAYETSADFIPYDNFELTPLGVRRVPGGTLRLVRSQQLANYADACNECGNCDVFCPETGAPFREKPRFFGSLEGYRRHAGQNGFYVDWSLPRIYGTIDGRKYELTPNATTGIALFETAEAEAAVRLSDNEVLSWKPRGAQHELRGTVSLHLLPYLKLKLLFESIGNPRHVNFANVAGLQEVTNGE